MDAADRRPPLRPQPRQRRAFNCGTAQRGSTVLRPARASRNEANIWTRCTCTLRTLPTGTTPSGCRSIGRRAERSEFGLRVGGVLPSGEVDGVETLAKGDARRRGPRTAGTGVLLIRTTSRAKRDEEEREHLCGPRESWTRINRAMQPEATNRADDAAVVMQDAWKSSPAIARPLNLSLRSGAAPDFAGDGAHHSFSLLFVPEYGARPVRGPLALAAVPEGWRVDAARQHIQGLWSTPASRRGVGSERYAFASTLAMR